MFPLKNLARKGLIKIKSVHEHMSGGVSDHLSD